jgi:hypothetical protein
MVCCPPENVDAAILAPFIENVDIDGPAAACVDRPAVHAIEEVECLAPVDPPPSLLVHFFPMYMEAGTSTRKVRR